MDKTEGEKVENSKNEIPRSHQFLRWASALGIGLIGVSKSGGISPGVENGSQTMEKGNTAELISSNSNSSIDHPVNNFVPVPQENIILPDSRLVTPSTEVVTDLSAAEQQKASVSAEERIFLQAHEFNSGNRSGNEVMMTYDDGGGKRTIEYLMDLYDQYNAKVTFFVPGEWVEQYPEVVKEIIDRGFEIGCHGWDHADMTKLTETQSEQQIIDFINEIAKIDPTYRVKLIRFPYGARDDVLKDIAAEYGLQSVMWGVESGGNTDQVVENIMNHVRSGSIVLNHSNRQYDISMAWQVLEALRKSGFSSVTVGEGMEPGDIFKESADSSIAR
jgi:peptidoglycan/xylan/chitin deacetylase (PgdA/CDA1 family)